MHCATAAIAFGLTFGIILDVTMVSGAIVTWYDHSNHRGDNRRFELHPNTCYNFGLWNDRISSIDTHNYCVILWSNHGCNGHRMVAAPGIGCHSNFRECEFNDIASSIQLCGGKKKREEGEVEETIAVRWAEDDEAGARKLAEALGILKRGGPAERNAAPFQE